MANTKRHKNKPSIPKEMFDFVFIKNIDDILEKQNKAKLNRMKAINNEKLIQANDYFACPSPRKIKNIDG